MLTYLRQRFKCCIQSFGTMGWVEGEGVVVARGELDRVHKSQLAEPKRMGSNQGPSAHKPDAS